MQAAVLVLTAVAGAVAVARAGRRHGPDDLADTALPRRDDGPFTAWAVDASPAARTADRGDATTTPPAAAAR